MQVSAFQPIAKLVNRITNEQSLSILHKSVELSEQAIRAQSEYGNIECFLPERIGVEPDEACLVDASAFCSIIASLPGSANVSIAKIGNSVHWRCGDAKGQWNIHPTEQRPAIIKHTDFNWVPPKNFGKALVLGASACHIGVVSIGLYGVVVDPQPEQLRMMSSNSVSFSMTTLPKDGWPMSERITLRPPVPDVIYAILDILGNEVKMDVTKEGVFIIGPWMIAQLPLGSSLDHDIAKISKLYSGNQYTIKIDAAAIRNFLNRASALADTGYPVNIGFKIDKGRLLLEHRSLVGSGEEFFLSDGLDPQWAFKSVDLTVKLLQPAMDSIRSATLDYLDQNILVLHGEDPEYIHMIGGVNKKG